MTENDPVNHPPHYTYGKKELLDIVEELFTDAECMVIYKFMVLRYNYRAEKKGKLQDLKKGQFYQNRLVKLMGGNK